MVFFGVMWIGVGQPEKGSGMVFVFRLPNCGWLKRVMGSVAYYSTLLNGAWQSHTPYVGHFLNCSIFRFQAA